MKYPRTPDVCVRAMFRAFAKDPIFALRVARICISCSHTRKFATKKKKRKERMVGIFSMVHSCVRRAPASCKTVRTVFSRPAAKLQAPAREIPQFTVLCAARSRFVAICALVRSRTGRDLRMFLGYISRKMREAAGSLRLPTSSNCAELLCCCAGFCFVAPCTLNREHISL